MPSEDSKPVKKEVESNNKSSVSKKVTNSNSKVAKVKKEEPQSVKKEPKHNDTDDDDIPLAKRTSNSKEVKRRKKIKEEEKKEGEKTKREKKVYDLPGQKRDPPEEKDPLRIFYESLHNQVPSSEMSQIWLMESGLLPKDVAMKVYEKKQKKGLQKLSSPVKFVAAAAVKSSNTKSVTVKKKSHTSPVPCVKRKTMNFTSKQSKKRKSKDQSSGDEDDNNSDDEVISLVTKRRKMA